MYCSAHLELPNLIEGANASKDDHLLATLCLQDLSDQLSDRVGCSPRGLRSFAARWSSALLELYHLDHGKGILADLAKILPTSSLHPLQRLKKSPSLPPRPFVAKHAQLAPLSPIQAGNQGGESEKAPVSGRSWLDVMAGSWRAKKRPLVGWLVKKEPSDLQYRLISRKSQAAIFSVEVMSHIVSASLTEDSYGVVQKDLEEIFNIHPTDPRTEY